MQIQWMITRKELDYSAASDPLGSVLLCGLVTASLNFLTFTLYLGVNLLTYTTCSRFQCRLPSDANGTHLLAVVLVFSLSNVDHCNASKDWRNICDITAFLWH